MKHTINFINSIIKYFGNQPPHETDTDIDAFLNEHSFKNVVVFLLDGLGIYNLELTCSSKSFLRSNLMYKMETVFPPTTVAATGMVETGLYPGENNRLGWFMYHVDKSKKEGMKPSSSIDSNSLVRYKVFARSDDNDKVIFMDVDEEKQWLLNRFYNNFDISKVQTYVVSKHGEIQIDDPKKQCKKIKELVDFSNTSLILKEKKMFIYAYNPSPDHEEHHFGVKSKHVKDVVRKFDKYIKKYLSNLDNTVVFVIADHGLIDDLKLSIYDFPDVFKYVTRYESVPDARVVTCALKDMKDKEVFECNFNHYFKDKFKLYTKEQVLKENLFGPIKENSSAYNSLLDYLIVSTSSYSIYPTKPEDLIYELCANHSGYTKEEMEVPLIAIYKKNK